MFASALILRWLGFDAERLPEDAEFELQFTHLPESWSVFVLIGLAGAVVYLTHKLYQKDNSDAPPWVRRLLTGLRGCSLLLLILILLGPAVSFNKVRVIQPVIGVLRDASDSMNEQDLYDDPRAAVGVSKITGQAAETVTQTPYSRAELVNGIADWEDGRFYQELEKRGRLQLLDFADRVTEVPTSREPESEEAGAEPVTVIPDLVASGPGTDLARAISTGLSERLTSGLVVFTDGQHNAESDLETVAAQARERQYRCWSWAWEISIVPPISRWPRSTPIRRFGRMIPSRSRPPCVSRDSRPPPWR